MLTSNKLFAVVSLVWLIVVVGVHFGVVNQVVDSLNLVAVVGLVVVVDIIIRSFKTIQNLVIV